MTDQTRGSAWWRPRSLRAQLLLWLITLHLIATVATAWYSFVAYGRLVHNALDEQMQLIAESYAGSDPPRTPRPASGEAALLRGAFVVQIWSGDGATLRASSWPALSVPLQSRPGWSDVRHAGTAVDGPSRWRVFTSEAGPHADQPRVQVLQNEDYRRDRALRRALLEGLPIALLLPAALLILWLIVSAASRSLRAVARDVAAQDERGPTGLSPTRVPEEIAPLVGAFNTLLARMRSALAAQRRFAQDAAHELRTPMAAIGLQLEGLRAHVPPGEATDRFNQLEAGVVRAQHLIGQLLSLSRQEAPAPHSTRDRVDLEVLLRESVGQLMVLADARRVDVGFQGGITAAVLAPAAELRSVFDNLIDNALRYAPVGGVVDIRLQAVDGHAVVDVLDNGPGVPEADIDRLFDRFFRLPGAAAGGSGLGLAIARAAAERNGLRIELRNRADGPGLMARVHLPSLIPG